MTFRPTVLKSNAELVMKENQERIKLQARQILNRVLNATLHDHDAEFVRRYDEDDVVWEVGAASKQEIEALFLSAANKELVAEPKLAVGAGNAV